jgi:hypothetical protein
MQRRRFGCVAVAVWCVASSVALGGCFASDGDGGAGSGGASGSSGSGGEGGDPQGGVGGSGASGGVGGGVGGIGGIGGMTAGMGGAPGLGGAPGIGGDGGFSGSAGAGGAGECMAAGDCVLVDERCCACEPPTLGEVRAARFDSMDLGTQCDLLCGACPEPVLPVTVVADCVGGTCTPVELATQSYTACMSDADCELLPTSCCGFCGQATLQNSFAITTGGGFQTCTQPIACPAIACPPTQFLVEAFCNADSHCATRVVE